MPESKSKSVSIGITHAEEEPNIIKNKNKILEDETLKSFLTKHKIKASPGDLNEFQKRFEELKLEAILYTMQVIMIMNTMTPEERVLFLNRVENNNPILNELDTAIFTQHHNQSSNSISNSQNEKENHGNAFSDEVQATKNTVLKTQEIASSNLKEQDLQEIILKNILKLASHSVEEKKSETLQYQINNIDPTKKNEVDQLISKLDLKNFIESKKPDIVPMHASTPPSQGKQEDKINKNADFKIIYDAISDVSNDLSQALKAIYSQIREKEIMISGRNNTENKISQDVKDYNKTVEQTASTEAERIQKYITTATPETERSFTEKLSDKQQKQKGESAQITIKQ